MIDASLFEGMSDAALARTQTVVSERRASAFEQLNTANEVLGLIDRIRRERRKSDGEEA